MESWWFYHPFTAQNETPPAVTNLRCGNFFFFELDTKTSNAVVRLPYNVPAD
jgi:hypothetical protein